MTQEAFSQLEKVLMRAAFDGAFAQQLVEQGETARERYGFESREGEVLTLLLENDGQGLNSIFNVIKAVIETRMMIERGLASSDMAGGTVAQTLIDSVRRHAG